MAVNVWAIVHALFVVGIVARLLIIEALAHQAEAQQEEIEYEPDIVDIPGLLEQYGM